MRLAPCFLAFLFSAAFAQLGAQSPADLQVISPVDGTEAQVTVTQKPAEGGKIADFQIRNAGKQAVAGYVVLQVEDIANHWTDRSTDLFERGYDLVKTPATTPPAEGQKPSDKDKITKLRAHVYTLPQGSTLSGRYDLAAAIDSLKDMKVHNGHLRVVFRTFPDNTIIAASDSVDFAPKK